MRTALLTKDIQPWYRQGWPWFLIAIPATAVLAGAVTLWLAITTWDGLVVDDYYQQGKAIEKTIGRSVRAREMGLVADFRLRAEEVSVRLSAAQGVVLPPTVVLTIAHPTRAGQDQKLLLKGRDGTFAGAVAPLSTGRWLIQLEDEAQTWRLTETILVPTGAEIRIVPADS